MTQDNLRTLSDKFQQAAFNHVQAMSNPKYGTIRTLYHMAKEKKRTGFAEEQLKMLLPLWDGDNRTLVTILNKEGIDTSRLTKASRRFDELFAHPDVTGVNQAHLLRSAIQSTSSMLRVAKKLGPL